ncbi:MAG: hypothetical protein J0L84_02385 [Verrucomicrobia bacterium]|nr:hypothetical protein [Verrucomicrobiota bacterium]
MRRHNAVAGWILGLGLVSAGCAVSPASKAPATATATAAPVAEFSPTDPTRLEVLPWAPTQPYRRLAEITVIPEQNTPPALIQTRLLDSAAALGAHALFVVSDPSHRLRLVQVDPLLEEQHPKYPTNGVVAVAIRYQ